MSMITLQFIIDLTHSMDDYFFIQTLLGRKLMNFDSLMLLLLLNIQNPEKAGTRIDRDEETFH